MREGRRQKATNNDVNYLQNTTNRQQVEKCILEKRARMTNYLGNSEVGTDVEPAGNKRGFLLRFMNAKFYGSIAPALLVYALSEMPPKFN